MLIAPPPPGWEMFIPAGNPTAPAVGFTASLPVAAEGWSFPVALLRPFAPLFGVEGGGGTEGFLAGLEAKSLLGVKALPAAGPRRRSLAWVGVALRENGRNLFAELRGGCWVPGFPAIGRDRELLRRAGIGDDKSLAAALGDLGLPEKLGMTLYFNFHHGELTGGGDRVYVLDTEGRRLHGFALPATILATGRAKCYG